MAVRFMRMRSPGLRTGTAPHSRHSGGPPIGPIAYSQYLRRGDAFTMLKIEVRPTRSSHSDTTVYINFRRQTTDFVFDQHSPATYRATSKHAGFTVVQLLQ